MIKTPTTKIIKYGKQIDKYLDLIHIIDKDLSDIKSDELNELLDKMDMWKDCISEIELKIKSVIDKEIITTHEYDRKNNEKIIY